MEMSRLLRSFTMAALSTLFLDGNCYAQQLLPLADILKDDPNPVIWFNDRMPSDPRQTTFDTSDIDYGLENLTKQPLYVHRPGFHVATTNYIHSGICYADANESTPQRQALDDQPQTITTLRDFLQGRKCIIFIHGCCMNFEDTLDTSNKLAKEAKCPVLVCDWPSVPFDFKVYKLKRSLLSAAGYHTNENRAETYQYRSDDTLADLLGMTTPDKTYVVAHSMGNRILLGFILDWLRRNTQGSGLAGTIWTNADLDVEQFVLARQALPEFVKRSYVLVSDPDEALALSYDIHWFPRLGAPKNQIGWLTSPGIYIIDHSKLSKDDHALPVKLISDLVNDRLTSVTDSSVFSIPAEKLVQQKDSQKLHRQ